MSEYAFQTGQLFRASAMEPEVYQQYLEDAFNQAWREKVTTLTERELALFEDNKHNRKKLWDLVKGQLSGKTLFIPPSKLSSLQRLPGTIAALEQQREALRIAVEDNLDQWEAIADQLKGSLKQNLRTIFLNRETDKIISRISKNPPAAYINEAIKAGVIDPALLNIAVNIQSLEATLEDLIDPAFTVLAIECAQYISQQLTDFREGEGQITFDDMITELHRAVCGNSLPHADERSDLGTILRNRYKAVFIDEFQDTDRFQYEIFATIFQQPDLPAKHILFYIGDPKQSIYAFRKADLQTYFRAEQAVQHKHLMNQNFRSTTHYIDAMNEF
ncbi:MAG: UvrD-helicase domain-containing protein, partial [Bacteroidota bacterium]